MLTPSDERECRQALSTAFHQNHPVAVRYPRGSGAGVAIETALNTWAWGKGVVRRQSGLRSGLRSAGRDDVRMPRLAILVFGTLLHAAAGAADKFDATLVDMRFVKPLDVELVRELAAGHSLLVATGHRQ